MGLVVDAGTCMSWESDELRRALDESCCCSTDLHRRNVECGCGSRGSAAAARAATPVTHCDCEHKQKHTACTEDETAVAAQ